MEAIAYARLPSRVFGAEAGAQSPILVALADAAERSGYRLARTFVDAAADRRRSAYQELVRYLREAPVDPRLLFIPDWHHLDEQPLRAAERLLEVETHGLAVRSLGDDGPLAAALAAWEGWRQRRGAQVRLGMERRAVQGLGLGRPPYGYRIGESGRFEVVEDEAATVRLIFRLYSRERLGLRRIAAQLNNEGRLTRRGLPWSIVSIRAILRNRAYLGTYDRFGFRVPSAHPAIVSPEEHRQVQARLGRLDLAGIAPQPSAFLLSDLARCGACGNTMMGVSRRQRWRRRNGEAREQLYRYYQCQSRRNLSLCQYRTHRAANLETMVVAELRRRQNELPAASAPRRAVSGRAERQHLLQEAAQGRMSLAELRTLAKQWFRPAGDRPAAHSWEQRLAPWESLTFAQQRGLLIEALEGVVVGRDHVELLLRASPSDGPG